MINEIMQQLANSNSVRHLYRKGCQVSFELYGIRCVFIIKADYCFLGVKLVQIPVTSLSTKQLSSLTMVLSGEKGVPNLNIFVSDNDSLYVFVESVMTIFISERWKSEFERLLVVRSCLSKLLENEPTAEKPKSLIQKNWLAI